MQPVVAGMKRREKRLVVTEAREAQMLTRFPILPVSVIFSGLFLFGYVILPVVAGKRDGGLSRVFRAIRLQYPYPSITLLLPLGLRAWEAGTKTRTTGKVT